MKCWSLAQYLKNLRTDNVSCSYKLLILIYRLCYKMGLYILVAADHIKKNTHISSYQLYIHITFTSN